MCAAGSDWYVLLIKCLCTIALISFVFLGNIVLTPEVFNLFLIYLAGFVGVTAYMFMKVELFSFGIWMVSCVTSMLDSIAEVDE